MKTGFSRQRYSVTEEKKINTQKGKKYNVTKYHVFLYFNNYM